MTARELLAFERGHAEGQALVYSQQVFAGSKLAATLQVKVRFLPDVEETCAREGCFIVTETEGDWAFVWIYKYPFVRLLIDVIKKRGTPKSALDTWVNGKLFGYSDYEIVQALIEEGYIEREIT